MAEAITHGLSWLQSTWLAMTMANSLYMMAGLSALHLVGFTLLMGSALVGNLRLVGIVLPTLTIAEVVRPARQAIAVGLAISVTTGFLLFSTRALNAAENWIFELKMALLFAAAVFHVVVPPRFVGAGLQPSSAARLAGAAGLLLWIGVALAGCAFIFLE